MSSADWTPFQVSGVSFTESVPTTPLPPGTAGTKVLRWQYAGGLTPPAIFGRMYNGPGIGNYPNKYTLVSVVQRAVVASSIGVGIIVAPTLFSGTVAASGLDFMFVGPNTTTGAGVIQLSAYKVVNGLYVTQTGATTVITRIGNSYIQYQIAHLFNDKHVGFAQEFRCFFRYNAGTAIEAPGGPNWTSWALLYELDWPVESVDFPGFASGFYPGIASVPIVSGGNYDNFFDDIRVTHGTELPP